MCNGKYPEHPSDDRHYGFTVSGADTRCPDGTGKAATAEQLGRVHTTSFLNDIFSSAEIRVPGLMLTPQPFPPASVEAAEVAAGTAIAAVEARG